MGNEGQMRLIRVAVVAGVLIAAVLLVVVFAVHRGGGARAAASQSPKPTSCESRLLRDWGDGRIDGTYPLACYRAALKSLPADLKVYSSAPDDIRQALSQRIVQSNHQKISGHQGKPSVRKVASAR
jgi:hypothetical protein